MVNVTHTVTTCRQCGYGHTLPACPSCGRSAPQSVVIESRSIPEIDRDLRRHFPASGIVYGEAAR